jgi:uncharacterized OB-fold protein
MNDSPYVELSHRLDYRHSLGQMAPFFAALSESRIAGTTCVTCQRTYVPPRARCSIDGSPAEWTDVSTSGTVVATSTIARRPRYAAAGPAELVLGLVQLDGVDTALLAELIDEPTVEAGARVEAVFRDATSHPAQQLAFAVENSPTARGARV